MESGIFREYDIRGIAGEELNEIDMLSIGKAFGTMLVREGKHKICVGNDCRNTAEPYTAAFIKGILSTGCDVARSACVLLHYCISVYIILIWTGVPW